MHGELLEAERGETLHMVEEVREAAEARAALQSCEAELAQWRETAEGAQASNAMMVVELEARREAEAEQAAARAELRAEQLRLRQANLGQGLGFKCANIVIDKKLLKNVGFNLVAIGSTGAKNACIGSTAPFHTRSRNDQFTKTGSGQT